MPNKQWRATVGLSYGNRRVAAGEVVDDIPTRSVPWLRDQGLIVDPADDPAPEAETEPEPEAPADAEGEAEVTAEADADASSAPDEED